MLVVLLFGINFAFYAVLFLIILSGMANSVDPGPSGAV